MEENKTKLFNMVVNRTNSLMVYAEKLSYEDRIDFLKAIHEIQIDMLDSLFGENS